MSIDRAISGEITTFKPAGGWIAGLVAGILAMTSACESGISSGSSSTTSGDATGTSLTSVTTKADFARTFDIGGREMYMECAGQGSPTVILVSGGGIAGDVWDSPLGKQPTVFPTVAEQTRTCVYDRPGTTRALAEGGISRSDPVQQPVVPSESAADLHAMLQVSGETGPVVLAAHSYGGLVARYYADRYPDDVGGMVLIDSFSPELRDSMGDNWPAWVRWNTPADEIIADYPDYERVDFDKALDEVDPNKAIKPMPMVVLTADAPYPAVQIPGVPADINQITRNAQDTSQREVAQLVPGAEHITETHSGHDIMLENPTLVSDSILDVVDAVRVDKTSPIEATPATPPKASETDTISPLVITALAPDPTPFQGSDDKFHVAYELTVLNFAPRPATITTVETVAPDGTVTNSRTQQQVAERTMIVADFSGTQPADEIPSGKTVMLMLEDVYATRADVPARVTHRIVARFGQPESGEGGIAELWPDEATQIGGAVTTARDEVVQIGAPLNGPGWVVESSCCTLNAHRNVMLPVGGRINGAERFAIDVSKIDVAASARGAPPHEVYIDGDPTKNESNRSYGAPILAVADATVVEIVADVPDTPPGTLPLGPGFTLANLGGNSVVLQLAPDLFAIYYHLAPGSPNVDVGDRVTKGQVIAELGNSGNSSAAHLHFQLSRTPLIFSADSVAYVLDDFTVVGTVDPTTDRLVPEPTRGRRDAAFPLALTVIDFP